MALACSKIGSDNEIKLLIADSIINNYKAGHLELGET
jgi:hypothetical protein